MGYKMAELFNKHTAPVTVTDADGQRITIQRGHSALVSGDFRNHLFVKSGMIRAEHDDDGKPVVTTVTTSGVSVEELEKTIAALRAQIDAGAGGAGGAGDGADLLDKDALRDQYEELFGEKAPSAASAKTLKKAIDERLAEIAAQSAGGAGDGTNENE
ncbi:hypothetical protein PEC106568_07000 [Pectobacterium carotovorum subsp. carotovorum]|nr:hypothetical protein PEC106568_07000 [Pectobacterium carotovorum subsp. carotovorum]